MSTINPQYQKQIPSKLLQKASNYTKNLKYFHELPKNISKSMVVHQQAEKQKDNIEFAIQQTQYQLQLYRRKQHIDQTERRKYENKIQQAADKVVKNEEELEKKRVKEVKVYEKHLNEIYTKYGDLQKNKRARQKQQAYKLRKELLQFHQKQEEKKKAAEFKQICVSTCYQNAVNRLNNIHKKNEQFSIKAEIQLNKSLNKNNHFEEIVTKKKRAISSINRNKEKAYNENLSIFFDRENQFIQKYGKNQDGSIIAFHHIEQECGKTKKRLGEFFKKRVEKWSTDKKRVDDSKAEVPQKCQHILQKTMQSSFRQTVSNFRSTAVEWNKKVMSNRSQIKEIEDMKKDEIMTLHLDLRLKNNSQYKVNEKMQSLRLQAKKVAREYL